MKQWMEMDLFGVQNHRVGEAKMMKNGPILTRFHSSCHSPTKSYKERFSGPNSSLYQRENCMLSISLLQANLVQNLLAVVLCFVTLFVAVRAIHIYTQTYSPRLFILGVSMSMLALTAAADFYSSNVENITLNTDWFLFIGQSVSLLFILLSFFNNTDKYFQVLMRLQILVSVLLLGLLLLSPTLPDFPAGIQPLLSGSRGLFCFGIFAFYMSAFTKKQTRFSLLMSISFLLLAFGYLIIANKYFVPDAALFDNAGDITRMSGLIVLLFTIVGS
jgi:hypothetical protein